MNPALKLLCALLSTIGSTSVPVNAHTTHVDQGRSAIRNTRLAPSLELRTRNFEVDVGPIGYKPSLCLLTKPRALCLPEPIFRCWPEYCLTAGDAGGLPRVT